MSQYKKENVKLELHNYQLNIFNNIFKKNLSTIKENKDYIKN